MAAQSGARSFLAGNDSWLSPGGRTARPRHRIRLSVHWSLLGPPAGQLRKELKELDNIMRIAQNRPMRLY